MLLSILHLGAIAVAANAQGHVSIRHSPIKIEATPAGDRDGDCATLRLSVSGKVKGLVHKFCRSSRIYDMNYGVVIIDDNVSISDMTVYYARNGEIAESKYRFRPAAPLKVETASFVLKGGNLGFLKAEATLSLSGQADLGPRTLGYRCVTVDRAGLRDIAGKCRS